MNAKRHLIVVGELPVATLAASIASSDRGAELVRVVELATDQIASIGAEFLAGVAPDSTEVFAAIGSSALNWARFDMWAKLRTRGFRFATLVHATAYVDSAAEVGENVLVGPGVVIESGVAIGRGTLVGSSAILAAGSTIGAWAWIGRHAVVGASSKVGDHTFIGAGVRLDDRTEFPGPGVLDVPRAYGGRIAPGTFYSAEFPTVPARFLSAGG